MKPYEIIADAGRTMETLLRRRLTPEIVRQPEKICLCRPEDVKGSGISIYLYDLQESKELRNVPGPWRTEEMQAYASVYLSLYYMLTPYSDREVGDRAWEQHRILGRLIQLLRDAPFLNPATGEAEEQAGEGILSVELLDMEYEEKASIWNSLNKPMEPAVYCRIYPVELESGRTRTLRRVREAEFRVGEGGESHG